MIGQDEELARLRAGVACATLLERNGFAIDRRESTRRCEKWRRGKGESLLVVHDGRGWWDPHRSSEDPRDFVAWTCPVAFGTGAA